MKSNLSLIVFVFLVIPFYSGAQSSTDTFKVKAKVESKPVYTFVEQAPEFRGGDVELMRTVQRLIVYPERERLSGIQGKVLLRFVVDIDGMVKDVTVTKSVSPGLDSAAVGALKGLPQFIPGRNQGKPVPVYYNLPVEFRLTK